MANFYDENKHLFGYDCTHGQELPSFQTAMEENYSQTFPMSLSNALESIAPRSSHPPPIFQPSMNNVNVAGSVVDSGAVQRGGSNSSSRKSPEFKPSFPVPLAAPMLQPLLQKPIPPSPHRAFPDTELLPRNREVRTRLRTDANLPTYSELPPHRRPTSLPPTTTQKSLPHSIDSSTPSTLRSLSPSQRNSPPPRLSPSPHAGDGGALRGRGHGVLNENVPRLHRFTFAENMVEPNPLVGESVSPGHSRAAVLAKVGTMLGTGKGLPTGYTNQLPSAVVSRVDSFQRIEQRRGKLQQLFKSEEQAWEQERVAGKGGGGQTDGSRIGGQGGIRRDITNRREGRHRAR